MNKITITDHGKNILSCEIDTGHNITRMDPAPKRAVVLTLAHSLLSFKGTYQVTYKNEEKQV
jgi:hypothetical protein